MNFNLNDPIMSDLSSAALVQKFSSLRATTASRAVRGRRDYMLKTIRNLARRQTTPRLLNVASGLGRDLRDLFVTYPELDA